MSDDPGRESLQDDFEGNIQEYSVDDEDQLQPEDTLDGSGDVLDDGYALPDRLQGVTAWGTTAQEQAQDETIDQRIAQEVPDPHSAYGAPDDESGMDRELDMVGGDDPDAIPADRDFLGSEGGHVGRLVAPDEGDGVDVDSEAVAREEAVTGWESPEEAAMHYVDEDEDLSDQ